MAFFVFVKMGKAPVSRALCEIKQLLCAQSSLLYKTNRFHVAVHLSSNRSQMTPKCGKNKKVAHEAIASAIADP